MQYENCLIAERILNSKSVISFKDTEKEIDKLRKITIKLAKPGLLEDTFKILKKTSTISKHPISS